MSTPDTPNPAVPRPEDDAPSEPERPEVKTVEPNWPEPAKEPREEPSDGPEGEPPGEDELFDRESLMRKEEG